MVDASQAISLTEKESKLVGTLRRVVEKNNLATVVRLNGGWVRDKV